MPQFPLLDPETLAQAIKTHIADRNKSRSASGLAGRPDYYDVVKGFADAIAQTANPSLQHFDNNDNTLFNSQGSGGGQGNSSLTFSSQGTISIGQWVVQTSSNVVSLSDASTFADGPSVGVVTGVPSQGSVTVQNSGTYTYSAQDPYSFLPLTPDSVYWISSSSGEITLSPNPPSGGFVQEVGYAKTAYQLVISIQEPIEI
tara:strand:- start:7183 stop:7785 length:603 start_codon:yes stop_codon:yes gene_type:complete